MLMLLSGCDGSYSSGGSDKTLVLKLLEVETMIFLLVNRENRVVNWRTHNGVHGTRVDVEGGNGVMCPHCSAST